MAISLVELIRYFPNNSSENWKTRSTITAAHRGYGEHFEAQSSHHRLVRGCAPHNRQIDRSARQRSRTVVLPAKAGLIFPCIAIVAAAAVVLALLTSPPNTPGASMP
jgi:hypothetical protein